MAIYLSLGTNLGDRADHLRRALGALEAESIRIGRVSPVVESPALLPADAPSDWNRPFLNIAVECATALEPEALLAVSKRIELALGRSDARLWSPRPIDIDILLYDERQIDDDALTVPHPGLAERAFALTPLVALCPGLIVPGRGASVFELSRSPGRTIPLWMGIVNLTPDSFSDGGAHTAPSATMAAIVAMATSGVQILDFGAESTRPGASPLSADDEWARLDPQLAAALEHFGADPLRPRISVDTYHPDVAARAIDAGVDIINDVGGLTDPAMLEVALDSTVEFVAMHNLGLPADPNTTLRTDSSAVEQVESWLDDALARWQAAGIELDRIVFDPGIGFGKTPLQSLELLRGIDRFHDRGLRLLVGHSRKSFMHGFAGSSNHERDLTTIGGSLALCERGVDILRVHNAVDHMTAYRGWAHQRRVE